MADNDKKLYLLDAMALIYRAHFAFVRNPRINSKGMNTSAVFGFANTLLEILNKEKPTHIGIVYDTDKPTFRHEQFEAYKAHRDKQPEDITIAIPLVMKLADCLGIPNLMLHGYEADDVVGTLAKKAASVGYEVYMMTSDKDYGQLVQPGIFQYKPSYLGKPAEILGVNEILERWGITDTLQVIDVLGLMGDSADNIPGIPGVGEKTAQKLISEYGSVEGLIANKDKLKGKLKESVENFADQAILSKQLATIDINVPIAFDEHALLIEPPKIPELKELFLELEFKAMGKRFFGDDDEETTQGKASSASSTPNLFNYNDTPDESRGENGEAEKGSLLSLDDVPHDYKLVSTAEERKELANYLKGFDVVAFDTETSALNPHECFIVGCSFSVKAGEGFYIPTIGTRDEDIAILNDFKEIFENENITIVGQNIKYDMIILLNLGFELKGKLFDTMLAHYLIEPDMRHNMDILSQKYLNYTPVPIVALIGSGRKQLSMADLDPEKIKDYAAEDADVTFQLREKLLPELMDAKADKLLYEVELPLVHVLADMESEGVRIDKDALEAFSIQLKHEMAEIEANIYEIVGGQFNINSPAQLGEILFDRMKLDPKAKRTSKSKQYSTNEEVLTALAPKHEIAQRILDYRGLQKLKSTYVDALPTLINKRTGRVHTTYNQAVAATGRLSSTDPNLQNIPIRTERGKEMRRAFIPRDDDHILLSADYSQIELRLIADLSEDEGMIQAFKDKIDIHTATAAKINHVLTEEVTPEMRRQAKMVNFGIIYGISAFGLSQRLGIPRGEAADIISEYNKQYPRINQYMHDKMEFARQHGYVETVLGRRRYLRDINSGNATTRGYAERNAINAPIQGSAADMIKVAMINIYKEFKKRNLKSKMILQVHDELVFDTLKTELEEVKGIVHDLMVHALDLKIPIEVEMGAGINWLEAH